MWMQWPVNDEPLNTFRTLELLFPISKKEFVLVLFQFTKTIVLNLLRCKIHHSCFHLIYKMYNFFPKWIVHSWSWHVTVLQYEFFFLGLNLHFDIFARRNGPSVTVRRIFEFVHCPMNLCGVSNKCNLNGISCAPVCQSVSCLTLWIRGYYLFTINI